MSRCWRRDLIAMRCTTAQMKAGIVMNVTCLLVLQLSINTWARTYLHLDQFPHWALSDDPYQLDVNATTVVPPALRES